MSKRDIKNFYLLITHIINGKNDAVEDILEKEGASTLLSKKLDNKITPMHLAIFCGNIIITGILLKNLAYVNCKCIDDCTPLHYACKFRFFEIALLLIRHHAKTDIKDNIGKTAFDWITGEGDLPIKSKLMEEVLIVKEKLMEEVLIVKENKKMILRKDDDFEIISYISEKDPFSGCGSQCTSPVNSKFANIPYWHKLHKETPITKCEKKVSFSDNIQIKVIETYKSIDPTLESFFWSSKDTKRCIIEVEKENI